MPDGSARRVVGMELLQGPEWGHLYRRETGRMGKLCLHLCRIHLARQAAGSMDLQQVVTLTAPTHTQLSTTLLTLTLLTLTLLSTTLLTTTLLTLIQLTHTHAHCIPSHCSPLAGQANLPASLHSTPVQAGSWFAGQPSVSTPLTQPRESKTAWCALR